MEKTLVVLKPDAVQRGLIGEILGRLERRGLKIVALRMTQVSDDLARRMYAVHEGKDFYKPLVRFITASPVVAMVVQGVWPQLGRKSHCSSRLKTSSTIHSQTSNGYTRRSTNKTDGS